MTPRHLLHALVGVAASISLVVAGLAACEAGGSGGGSSGDPLSLIGKSFEDPAVADLVTSICGGYPNDNVGNVKCLNQGFELNLLSDLSVGSVTLWNEELGDGFRQYQGTMPYGLSWNDTFPTVVQKLGDPDGQYGGNGVDVWVLYENHGPYRIEVHFNALHNNPDDLANARVRMIHASL